MDQYERKIPFKKTLMTLKNFEESSHYDVFDVIDYFHKADTLCLLL